MNWTEARTLYNNGYIPRREYIAYLKEQYLIVDTDLQRLMVSKAYQEGKFYGVGREIGRMVYWPLISLDSKGRVLKVIDPLGYRMPCSPEGRLVIGQSMIKRTNQIEGLP